MSSANTRPARCGLAIAIAWVTACDLHGTDPLSSTTSDREPIAQDIVVDNLSSGDTIRYPLALVQGIADPNAGSIDVAANGAAMAWPVADRRFRALVRLRPGPNTVTLTTEATTASLVVNYVPHENPRYVRMVYIVAEDGDGSFEGRAGEPSTQASAVARLSLAGEMMQTFYAEALHKMGRGRRTFRLLRDSTGRPDVTVFRTTLSTQQLLAMNGDQLWQQFYSELSSLPDRDNGIDMAVMAFSHYDPSTGVVQGHTALGGGRLALFGSLGLHAWAQGVDEVPVRFADEFVVDGSVLPPDANRRNRSWAVYASNLGAISHEVGHCLSLPHPDSGSWLMTRGFDFINRWFAVIEPPSAAAPGIDSVPGDLQPEFHPGNAARIAYHRFLDVDGVDYSSNTPPTFEVSADRLTIRSDSGIRHAFYRIANELADYREFPDVAPRQVTIDLHLLALEQGVGARFNVDAIDTEGNIASSSVVDLPATDPDYNHIFSDGFE